MQGTGFSSDSLPWKERKQYGSSGWGGGVLLIGWGEVGSRRNCLSFRALRACEA